MNSLEEHLYSYLMDHIYKTEQTDSEYQLARELRDVAEKELCASLTSLQKQQFSHYLDQENHLSSLELRHMFRAALALLRGTLL